MQKSDNPQFDAHIEKLVTFLFGFQPPDGRKLPTIDWDLFKMPPGAVGPNYNGVVVGEGLTGLHPDKKIFIWPEVAHIDLLIGNSTGPVGTAFANAIASQNYGFNNLLAVVNPNLMVKPPVAIVTKVKTDSRERANQMFGPAQSAIADAMVDAVEHGIIPSEGFTDLVCVASIFIDPNAGAKQKTGGGHERDDKGRLVMLTGEEAADSNHRIYCFNYLAMLAALWFACSGGRGRSNLIAAKAAGAAHVLRGFTPKS